MFPRWCPSPCPCSQIRCREKRGEPHQGRLSALGTVRGGLYTPPELRKLLVKYLWERNHVLRRANNDGRQNLLHHTWPHGPSPKHGWREERALPARRQGYLELSRSNR